MLVPGALIQIRTGDLVLTKNALCQLSYEGAVGPARPELPASRCLRLGRLEDDPNGGESRIRTCEARSAADLQSAAINHSAISPRVAHRESGGPVRFGAQEGTRTPNLLFTKQLRCQLRYPGSGQVAPQGVQHKKDPPKRTEVQVWAAATPMAIRDRARACRRVRDFGPSTHAILIPMTTAQRLLTADEFILLPDAPDGGRMELLDGTVLCMPPVGEDHGQRAGAAYRALYAFSAAHALGLVQFETGFRIRIDPDRVVAPDVSFVETARLDPDRDHSKYIAGPPTLAVEVVSPTDLDRDVADKVVEYLEAGAARVWVVRPRSRTVTVHRPGGDAHTYAIDGVLGTNDAGFVVEGFTLPLADLFA
jgi:Uma2 family endonuclease